LKGFIKFAAQLRRWQKDSIFELKMYYVYAIKSLVRNYIYVGLTDDVER
jgi:hypothetical protein